MKINKIYKKTNNLFHNYCRSLFYIRLYMCIYLLDNQHREMLNTGGQFDNVHGYKNKKNLILQKRKSYFLRSTQKSFDNSKAYKKKLNTFFYAAHYIFVKIPSHLTSNTNPFKLNLTHGIYFFLMKTCIKSLKLFHIQMKLCESITATVYM